jgi:hypothetical protein
MSCGISFQKPQPGFMPGLFLSVSVFLRVFPVLWWLYHALYISLLLQDSSIADTFVCGGVRDFELFPNSLFFSR